MYYVTIDCGTTNSRAYVVDATGKIFGKATKTVGVKDTATTGSKKTLQEGLREIILEAIAQAGLAVSDITAVLSSGMITSEIGLVEIPHLVAPCGVETLAENITQVKDVDIIDEDIPVYFVRGIKNAMDAGSKSATKLVGEADFMRGEEAQVMGMLAHSPLNLPVTILILSSHTKFIPVDASGMVLGSLTTMSGQLYDAIINHTFVGKSIRKNDSGQEKPEDYFDKQVVENALAWVQNTGLVRSLMFPRFLDVLLDTTWYERHLFFEAMIAAEDMLAIGQLDMLVDDKPSNFVLVGSEDRCKLYRLILNKKFPEAVIHSITQTEEIDALSIHGVLTIARKAGIVK